MIFFIINFFFTLVVNLQQIFILKNIAKNFHFLEGLEDKKMNFLNYSFIFYSGIKYYANIKILKLKHKRNYSREIYIQNLTAKWFKTYIAYL